MYAAGSVLCWFLSRRLEVFTAPRIRLVFWSGAVILAACIMATFVQHSLWVAGFAFFLIRAGRTIRNPILGQMQNEHIPSGSRATALSILSLLAGFGLPAIFAACAAVVFIGLLFPVREAA